MALSAEGWPQGSGMKAVTMPVSALPTWMPRRKPEPAPEPESET
jgi:hypothetical protein